jgi:sec-independent protein translocase protein TatA
LPGWLRGDNSQASRSEVVAMGLGPWHLLIVVIVILLLFGGSRLADIGKGLGEGIRALKKGLSDDERKADASKKAEEPPAPKQLPSVSASTDVRAKEEPKGEDTSQG